MNSTTTCTFADPLDFQGNTPATSSDSFAFSTQVCSHEGVAVSGGFTYGELVTSLLLFFLLITTAYSFFFFWLRGVKVRA